MKVAVGCDHAGLSLKNDILPVLEDLGIQWEDFGTTSEDSCDYPDFGSTVSEEVSFGRFNKGILLCCGRHKKMLDKITSVEEKLKCR